MGFDHRDQYERACPKQSPIRSRKLLDLCKGQLCYLRFAGCEGKSETVVPCHSPFLEDRRGTKAGDDKAVPGCMTCHDLLDMRRGFLPWRTRRGQFVAALKEWQATDEWREARKCLK